MRIRRLLIIASLNRADKKKLHKSQCAHTENPQESILRLKHYRFGTRTSKLTYFTLKRESNFYLDCGFWIKR